MTYICVIKRTNFKKTNMKDQNLIEAAALAVVKAAEAAGVFPQDIIKEIEELATKKMFN